MPDEFIADVGGEGDEDGLAPRAEVNARLNRERELNDQDLQKIAAEYSERYRRTNVRYTGDMNDIPQRLLMPSVHDANLWQVRVKVSLIIPFPRIIHLRVNSKEKSAISCLALCARQWISNSRTTRFKSFPHSSVILSLA